MSITASGPDPVGDRIGSTGAVGGVLLGGVGRTGGAVVCALGRGVVGAGRAEVRTGGRTEVRTGGRTDGGGGGATRRVGAGTGRVGPGTGKPSTEGGTVVRSCCSIRSVAASAAATAGSRVSLELSALRSAASSCHSSRAPAGSDDARASKGATLSEKAWVAAVIVGTEVPLRAAAASA